MPERDEGAAYDMAQWYEFRAADMSDDMARHAIWHFTSQIGYTPVSLATILRAIADHTALLIARKRGPTDPVGIWSADLIYFYALCHEPSEENRRHSGGTLFVKGYSCATGKFVKLPLTVVVSVRPVAKIPADALFPTDDISILNVDASLAYLRLAGEATE